MRFSIEAGNLRLFIDSETRRMSVETKKNRISLSASEDGELSLEHEALKANLEYHIKMCVETLEQNNGIKTEKRVETQLLETIKERNEMVFNNN